MRDVLLSPPTHRLIDRALLTVVAVVLLTGACSVASEPAHQETGHRGSQSAGADFCAKALDALPTAASYRALAAEAPPEVQADFERVASSLYGLDQVDESELPNASEAVQDDPAYLQAINRIRQYLLEECGVASASEETSGATPATPSSDPQATAPPQPGDTAAGDADGPGTEDPDEPEPPEIPEGPGVPHEDVKARLRDIFGDRLWGTSFDSSREGVFEFEANVAELIAAEALSACEELSSFLSEHSDAAGTTELRLTDFPPSGEFNVLARNSTITPGNPGSCEAG